MTTNDKPLKHKMFLTDNNWRKLRNNVPTIILLLVGLIAGSSMISAYGPLSVPDPSLHVSTTYALATGQSFNRPILETDAYGNSVRMQYITGESSILKAEANNSTITDLLQKQFVDDTLENQIHSLRQPSHTITVASRSNQYPPMAYMPQAVGMWTARALKLDNLRQLQAARISNLIFYLFVCTVAITRLKTGKWIYTISLANPISIFIASSLSGDSMVISVSALAVASIATRMKQHKTLSISDSIYIAIIFSLLIPLKLAYSTLYILFLAIPSYIWPIRKRLITASTSITIGLIPYFIWFTQIGKTYAISNESENINYLTHHFVKSLFTIVSSSLNSLLSLLFIPGIMSSVLMLIIIVMYNTGHHSVDWINALLVTFIILSSMILIETALFLTWNSPSHQPSGMTLLGFQERYVIPLLPTLIMPFYKRIHVDE